ncbi:MAG: hypothetical protein ACRCVK_03965 [Aeromonas veronii]
MIQRGRKSGAALALVSETERSPARLPEPPEHMTDEQGLIWRTVMASPIAAVIRPEAHPILEEYCRAAVNARRIATLIEGLDDDSSIEDFDKLLNMQARAQRAMSSLAEKLRLTPSTVKNGEVKAGKALRIPHGQKPLHEDY